MANNFFELICIYFSSPSQHFCVQMTFSGLTNKRSCKSHSRPVKEFQLKLIKTTDIYQNGPISSVKHSTIHLPSSQNKSLDGIHVDTFRGSMVQSIVSVSSKCDHFINVKSKWEHQVWMWHDGTTPLLIVPKLLPTKRWDVNFTLLSFSPEFTSVCTQGLGVAILP